MQPVNVAALGVRVFLVTRCGFSRSAEQDFPWALFLEQTPRGSFLTGDGNQAALCAAADFESHRRHRIGGGGAQRIVIRESREKSRKFIGLGDEAFPRIPKTVVYDRPSTKDLLHPQLIFSRDAQN